MSLEQLTPGTFLVALKSQLVARFALVAGMELVRVYTVPPQADLSLEDCVVLVRGQITEEQEYIHPNRNRNELTTIPGFVYAYSARPNEQANEEAAMLAAMGRAKEILSEIVDEVKLHAPEVANQTRSALVSRMEWAPFPIEKLGWGCQVNFDVTYAARVL